MAAMFASALVIGGCGVSDDTGQTPVPNVPETIDLAGQLGDIEANVSAVDPTVANVGQAVTARAEREAAEAKAAEEAAAEEAAAKQTTNGGSTGGGKKSGGNKGGRDTGGGGGGKKGCAPNCNAGNRPGPKPPVEGGDPPKCSTGASPCIPD
jgi:hypothetical protein